MILDTEDDKKSVGRGRESRSLQNGRKLEVESGGEERLLTFCCPSKKSRWLIRCLSATELFLRQSIGERPREDRGFQNERKLEVESGGEERLLSFCCPSKTSRESR